MHRREARARLISRSFGSGWTLGLAACAASWAADVSADDVTTDDVTTDEVAAGDVAAGDVAADRKAAAPSGWLSSYDAPAACPSKGSFREQVERRIAGPASVLGNLRVAVDITRERASASVPARWRAALHLTDAQRHVATQELADPSCPALVRALALWVALRADAVVHAAAREADLAPPPPSAPPRDLAQDTGSATHRASAAEGQQDAPRVAASLLGVVRSALAPEPALGIGVGASLQWPGSWAPRLELSLQRMATSEVALTGATEMRFQALLASGSACPLRWPATGDWSLRPCLDLEVGQLTARSGGPGVVRAEPRRAPWFATGVSARAEVVPLGGPIRVGASLGLGVPITRHEFFIAPDLEGFSVPPVGWNAAVALAWSF